MAETKIVQVDQVKVCWPDPDWCCLEGGCGYCHMGKWVNIGTLRTYAEKTGVLTYEDGSTKDYPASFQYGLDNRWPNYEKRTVPKRVPA